MLVKQVGGWGGVRLPVLTAVPEQRLLYELTRVPPEYVVVELAHLLPAHSQRAHLFTK